MRAMPGENGGGEGGDAAQGSTGGGLGHLPWQQIPKFVPGVTNVDEYVQRLKFLKELWPAEHIHLLGPRAALQVEGSAFGSLPRNFAKETESSCWWSRWVVLGAALRQRRSTTSLNRPSFRWRSGTTRPTTATSRGTTPTLRT